jgi:hypothetical protein
LISRRILFAILALMLAVPSAADAAGESDGVRQSFQTLKVALLRDRGAEAVRLVSRSTLALSGRVRELALYGSKAELEAQPTAMLAAVLSLRRSVGAQKLQSMPPRDLVAYAVDTNLTRDGPIAGIDLGGVRVNQGFAAADIVSDGPFPVSQLQFVKEEGFWKLDLSDIAYGQTALDKFVAALAPNDGAVRQSMRNELVLAMIAANSGGGIDGSIWQPPLQRP